MGEHAPPSTAFESGAGGLPNRERTIHPMKVIVTGGCGFIGSALCRYGVQDLGWTIVNIDSLTYASTSGSTAMLENSGRYLLAKADIADKDALHSIFAEHRPDAVVHLAAESHVDRSIDGPLAFVHTNVTGTACLLEAVRAWRADLSSEAAARFRFVHVSTDEVFGSLAVGHEKFNETTPYNPSSPYSATKAGSDHLVRAYAHTFDLPVVMTNCSNNYGPYQFPEKLIPLMIIKAARRLPLPVYGTGANIRDWLAVEDHVRAIGRVLEQGRIGESYNIGGNAERSNLEVVEAVCDLIDARMPDGPARRELITFVADRPGHDLRYAVDAGKIERELGWRPSVTFEQGLEATVDWYLANRDWWQAILDREAEAEGRLGMTVPVKTAVRA